MTQADMPVGSSPARKKLVLIVEDELPLAHTLETKFRHAGFETRIAGDGEGALQELSRGGCDVVLLDLIMPRMDGFMVLQEMQKRGLKTPTIVLSNLEQEEDKVRAKELGAVKYFTKAKTSIAEIVTEVNALF